MKKLLVALLLTASVASAQQPQGWQPSFGPPIANPPTMPQPPQTVFYPNGQTATILDNGAFGKTIIAPNGQIYNVQ